MAEVNEKRAILIATDQVGKLNSQLVQLEQMSQGVEKYKWQTMEDSRVRKQHQSYNQKDFSWSEPPDGGHPGWAIRCRCVAIPLYDTDKIGLQPKAGSYKKV
jgi:SPP1 gp7 family putative phage head morphogenesis protein